MERDNINKKLNHSLIKLASGFYYTETSVEYIPKHKSNVNFNQLSLPELSNEKKENFTVSKKKVTKHYVPPDMLAIKMLLENNGQKMNALENMTDEELLSLRNSLIKEILNDEQAEE